jgi:hypothetical protein
MQTTVNAIDLDPLPPLSIRHQSCELRSFFDAPIVEPRRSSRPGETEITVTDVSERKMRKMSLGSACTDL